MRFAWWHIIAVLLVNAAIFCISAPQPMVHSNRIASDTYALTIVVPIIAPQIAYRDYITLNVDHPHITLTPWKATPESVVVFDKHFKKDKHIFTNTVVITCQAQLHDPIKIPVHIHLSYITGPRIRTHHVRLNLPIEQSSIDHSPIETLRTQEQVTLFPYKISHHQPATSPLSQEPAECTGPGCIAMSIIVLLAGLLLLNQADQEHSESSLHCGIIALIIAVLIIIHGYQATLLHHKKTAEHQQTTPTQVS